MDNIGLGLLVALIGLPIGGTSVFLFIGWIYYRFFNPNYESDKQSNERQGFIKRAQEREVRYNEWLKQEKEMERLGKNGF